MQLMKIEISFRWYYYWFKHKLEMEPNQIHNEIEENKIRKERRTERGTCLELHRERGKNNRALLLKDLADVVAGGRNHRQENWFPHSLSPLLLSSRFFLPSFVNCEAKTKRRFCSDLATNLPCLITGSIIVLKVIIISSKIQLIKKKIRSDYLA